MSGTAVDAGVLGFSPPFLHRQVNEYWLGRYRAWVYGSGFGWQIGTGVTTYIMTAAVFLTIALGALSASPLAAFLIGVCFGLARGLAENAVPNQPRPGKLPLGLLIHVPLPP